MEGWTGTGLCGALYNLVGYSEADCCELPRNVKIRTLLEFCNILERHLHYVSLSPFFRTCFRL
jgi:hypothetical protein